MSETNLTQPNPQADKPVASARTRAYDVRPSVDVYENSDELLLLADMPGANAESVKLRVDDQWLIVNAQRTAADGVTLHYRRAFQLPDVVDSQKISAELKHGVLHVHLGKTERAKPRTIAVRVA